MDKKIVVSGITVLVIALLILSGPLNAFNLDLTANKDSVIQGGKVIFTASLDINSNERLNVNYLEIFLDGPDNGYCRFNLNGTKLSSCDGIDVELLFNTATYTSDKGYSYGYGYGYGYGYEYNSGYSNGQLKYEITLDTEEYKDGDYNTKLRANIDGNLEEISGPDFEIKKPSTSIPMPMLFSSSAKNFPVNGKIYLGGTPKSPQKLNSLSPIDLSMLKDISPVWILVLMNMTLVFGVFFIARKK